ncbi:MAG: hisA/hisF family protein [Planctomycetia bacterium]|nr:hisA/hisF family protein [Planctomycetia bacterium]
MKILPVIDLLAGVVVQGIAGRRSEYRPIVSRLCADPSPASVARGFRDTFGFDTCYLADLDAIAGAEPSWRLYDEVVAAGLQPWIDAGTGDVAQARALNRYLDQHAPQGRVVIGLESLLDADSLSEIIAALSPQRAVFSLDLRDGRPLTSAPAFDSLDPMHIAEFAVAAGIEALIVLDLSAVGMNAGVPTLVLCRTLRARYPKLELISGGGVRNQADLRSLAAAGCNQTLLSSALHKGDILL